MLEGNRTDGDWVKSGEGESEEFEGFCVHYESYTFQDGKTEASNLFVI